MDGPGKQGSVNPFDARRVPWRSAREQVGVDRADVSSLGGLPASGLEQLAAIVESSDDAIVGKTLDGVILSWNAAAEQMYGFAAEEVMGQRISAIVPADRARELESILRSVARGDRIDHLETV